MPTLKEYSDGSWITKSSSFPADITRSGSGIQVSSGTISEKKSYVSINPGFAPDMVTLYFPHEYATYSSGDAYEPCVAVPFYLLPAGGFNESPKKGTVVWCTASPAQDKTDWATVASYVYRVNDGTFIAWIGIDSANITANVPLNWTAYKFL